MEFITLNQNGGKCNNGRYNIHYAHSTGRMLTVEPLALTQRILGKLIKEGQEKGELATQQTARIVSNPRRELDTKIKTLSDIGLTRKQCGIENGAQVATKSRIHAHIQEIFIGMMDDKGHKENADCRPAQHKAGHTHGTDAAAHGARCFEIEGRLFSGIDPYMPDFLPPASKHE